MKFCFVILHYKTADDTIECIKSIEMLNGKAYIVVVDNASNNGSIEKVEKICNQYDNIHIIKNNENLGFAAGNNVGFRYAKNEVGADFIAVLNNDIIVPDKEFIHQVEALYADTKFDVAGPDIESLADHGHQNPMLTTVLSVKAADKEIFRYKFLAIINKTGLYEKFKKNRQEAPKTPVKKTEKRMENVTLHGAFVIFSKNFIDREEYCFRPGTFLYMEEAILYRYCMDQHYKLIYDPDIKVFHKEDSSTSSLFTASKDKRDFVFSNMVKSLKVYRKILNG